MISTFMTGLASAVLSTGIGHADDPSRLLDATISRIERLEDGSAAADYYLCWVRKRIDPHPYYQSVPPIEVFDGFEAAVDEINGLAAAYPDLTIHDLEIPVLRELEDRDLSWECEYILIPDSDYLRRVADQAEYRINAERQLVNPAQDFEVLVDDHLDRLEALANGRTVLTAGACLQRHQWPSFYQGIRIADFSSDPQGVEASIETFLGAQSVFAMSRNLFDENAIWDAAYDARVAPMSRRECQQLLTPYLAD